MAADILGAAVELFGEQGYDNVSMRELAARAGCSPVNPYHHHGSKYDIFVQLMRRAMDLHLAGLREAVAEHDDPVAQLRHVLSHHLLLHMERRDEYERGVREIVARAVVLGLVRVEDPKLAVMTALAACTQVDRWYRPDGDVGSAGAARRITGFLLAGFGVSRPRGASR